MRSLLSRLPSLFVLLACSGPVAEAGVVQGRVVDGSGAGVEDVDLDFIDEATGLTHGCSCNDNTDLLGYFAVEVPPGTYTMRHDPPPGAGLGLRGVEVEGVVVGAGGLTRPDVVLPPGFTITGRVVDPGGLGVEDVDLDVRNESTGDKIFVSNDNTDAAGDYEIVAPPGTFTLEYDPPAGLALLPVDVTGVAIASDQERPTVVLPAGSRVSGRVIDSGGAPVPDTDLSFRRADGTTARTVDDDSIADGTFRTFVADGSYSIVVTPPAGSRFIAASRTGVVVSGSTVLPDFVLESGFQVSGRVIDESGSPLPEVDTDWLLPEGAVLTPHDDTDAAGLFVVVVPGGTYTAEFEPVPGLRIAAARLTGLVVGSDRVLPDVVLSSAWLVSGRVVDPAGSPVASSRIDTDDAATGVDVATSGAESAADGAFAFALPDGTYDLTFDPPAGSPWLSALRDGLVVDGDDVVLGDVALLEDTAEPDSDSDGAPDGADNCPDTPNPEQGDRDVDGLGDLCDPDADGDEVADAGDNCVLFANPGQEDADTDGLGDACEFTWADVAPVGAPDGVVRVDDVIRSLRFAVQLESPTADELKRCNVAEARLLAAGPPVLVVPLLSPPADLDVSDVILTLRAAVGLTVLDGPY